MTPRIIKSHHIFLFPFRWDLKSEDTSIDNISFESRANMHKIKSMLANKIINQSRKVNGTECKWQFFNFEIKSAKDFSEYNYFYPYLRDAFFSKQTNEADDHISLLQLEYQGASCLNYEIEANFYQDESQIIKHFILEIENITLNIYNPGIGILAFHLSNYLTNDQDDILLINDFRRRIYPQYLGGNPLTSAPKSNFLAQKITLTNQQNKPFTTPETFKSYDTLPKKDNVLKLPNFISEILTENFQTNTSNLKLDQVLIEPVIDDRMFVCCWYGNSNKIKNLANLSCSIFNKNCSYSYIDDSWWYKYIFIDGKDLGAGSCRLRHELSEQHTYYRHIEFGTLIGVSRYSFVMLTTEINPKDIEKGFSFIRDVLLVHIQTMYFQLVMMALIQRASVIRFSHEVTNLSSLENINQTINASSIESLHKKYIQFVNKFYFREITAQEQGIDLYDMLLTKMDTERNVRDLNKEIDELDQFITLKEQSKQTQQATTLTKVATILLPASLIAGILGMNTLDTNQMSKFLISCHPQWAFWISILTVILISYLIISLINYRFELNLSLNPFKRKQK